MSADSLPESGTFKDWFNTERYESIADSLGRASSKFDRKLFLNLTLTGLADRELMDRLRQTSVAAAASLPGNYARKLKILRKVAAPESNGMIGVWYSDFVGQFGLDEPELSLPALSYFTQFGSAEFAIREFLIRSPQTTLKVMRTWSTDANEHVRRLASEGSRPRLPWGKRLGFLVEDPTPTRIILETLRNDPSLYVRKSVANHLNDISKDHPDFVLDMIEAWDRSNAGTAWIIRQGLRTLVKKAHPRTLQYLGVGQAPRLSALEFTVSPQKITLGDRIQLDLKLISGSKSTQTLLVDYVVHYVKASGVSSAKVFKWKQLDLAPRDSVVLKKSQVIRDFSTRKHYSGLHRIEIQINGRHLAEASFDLGIRR